MRKMGEFKNNKYRNINVPIFTLGTSKIEENGDDAEELGRKSARKSIKKIRYTTN